MNDTKGYLESRDLAKIPKGWLAYPSKNVFSYKGKVVTRGGLENDGTVATVQEPVHSETVWKDCIGGARPIRVHGTTVQVKYNDKWYTIFTGITATTRVYFTTWLDGNSSIYRKRLVMSDGSTKLHVWNGAIAEVESATSNSVTFATAGGTCLRRGFDAGNVTNQNIMHFIGSATVANSTETYTNDASAQVLNLSGTFDTTPVAGDVIISAPVTFNNAISANFNIDVVYTYKNHVVCANFDSPEVYFSHVSTYSLATGFDFAMPILANRTALTPIFMQLDGNFQGMIARRNTLWISDYDDWYKVNKNNEVNSYGLWVDVEKFETGERKGTLPMALAIFDGDIVYLSQEGTLQRLTQDAVTAKDELMLLSDEIEGLLNRLDKTDVRIKYLTRAIYLIFPNDSTVVMLDTIEKYFQPPQIMPVNCMSVIEGVLYGHHNVENQTFQMFTGRSDLEADLESIIAYGYTRGQDEFEAQEQTYIGVSCRLTDTTSVTVDMEYEEDGAVAKPQWNIVGNNITKFYVPDDTSWGTHPYGTYPLGGSDPEVTDLRRAIVFKKQAQVKHYNFRPIFTVSGQNNEFHLLAFGTDMSKSSTVTNKNLFVDN